MLPYNAVTASNRRNRSLMTLPEWGQKVLLLAIIPVPPDDCTLYNLWYTHIMTMPMSFHYKTYTPSALNKWGFYRENHVLKLQNVLKFISLRNTNFATAHCKIRKSRFKWNQQCIEFQLAAGMFFDSFFSLSVFKYLCIILSPLPVMSLFRPVRDPTPGENTCLARDTPQN